MEQIALETHYYTTKKQMLQFLIPITERVISFGKHRRFSTSRKDEIEYLKNLLETEDCPAFKVVSKEEFEAAGPKGPSEHDKQAQILAAMAMSRGGEPLQVEGNEETKPPITPASTQSSPLTGGQNPAGMNVTQAETMAAMRAKLAGKQTS